ncbi:hypothetical protein H5410_047638 [Solanum commersonii]|uniref:Methylcrotonoyl-CoA carboxylase subunit alpha, mitochondrial n=1 Tax=Solanum commersonii TaxID=4109 RepID=A0A9J5XIV5_SOLCO|nr:hypothetical protein H5410_047638 [Solanum commersonii]
MSMVAFILRRKVHTKPYISQQSSLYATTPSIKSSNNQRIEKILIANRGEIACRVIRTAKRLGIRTVAVYSDADRDSLHVKSADEAFRIGPPPARLSYLNSSAIIEVANKSGAQAIHPGYGFLSESADFAQLCEDENLLFIGPPASAIRDMGDKSASKRIMGAAGVPLVPGYHGDEQDIDFMKLEADKIGYPILIKPTHGGGGKGMRIVQSPNEFADSFLGAQREAAASFGISTILLEKYITKPRHIEVQIFGDKQGNIIHLYERDCSVQRRHQKIIEEAPAPNVSSDFRSHLGQAAVSAAKVEHPVTEMIVGQDLVEWQIRVANGEPLPLTQSEVPFSGHAFEARIYAENVPKGFLPATGVLHHYCPVTATSAVRVETGVEEGDTVSMHYDPMIAKLVVWGQDRLSALIKMKDCLSKFQVAGLPTNIDFIIKLASHRAFQNGEVETHFIERYKDDLFIDSSNSISAEKAESAAKHAASIVAACICQNELATLKNKAPGGLHLWYGNPPFRINHFAKRTVDLEWENQYSISSSNLLTVSITYLTDGKYLVETGESNSPGLEIQVTQLSNNDYRVEVDGLSLNVCLAAYSKGQIEHIHIWHGDSQHHFKQWMSLEIYDDEETIDRPARVVTSYPSGTVIAPMAGLVVKVLVKDGEKVQEGQPVLVLEAMKMEHVMKAPVNGYVRGLEVKVGQSVQDGIKLFALKI